MHLDTSQLNPSLIRCTHFNGYEFQRENGLEQRMVYHYEIEYYLRGEGGIVIDGVTVPFAQGEINFRKPGQIVRGILPYECLFLSLAMDGSFAVDTSPAKPILQPRYENPILEALPDKIHARNDKRIAALIYRIYRRHLYQSDQDILQNKIDLLLLLEYLYELCEPPKSSADYRVRQAVDRIQKHFTEDLSIGELIETTQLSKAHFHKLFREYTGHTPNGLIIHLRMELAKHLLTTSQEKISNIAAGCGYYDHVYFSYLFKKETGLSPGAYRKIYFRGE
ncbi:MAG: helix-turn-helix domain-containing protein [Massiliimalia sp.]|jgi:AraC-like DNA-binding protein